MYTISALFMLALLPIGFDCSNEKLSKDTEYFDKVWISSEFKSATTKVQLLITEYHANSIKGFLKFTNYNEDSKFLSYNPGDIGNKAKIIDIKEINNINLCWTQHKKYINNNIDAKPVTNAYSDTFIIPIDIELSDNNPNKIRSFVLDYMVCNKFCIPVQQIVSFKISDVANIEKISELQNSRQIFHTNKCEKIIFNKQCTKIISYK